MNAILGHAQIMQRDAGLPDVQRKSVTSINKSGEHLLALINDILDMSKIEAGKTRILPVSFLLHSLLQELADMFRMRIQDKGLSLEVEIDPGLPDLVLADENRVRQVLINLLGNAAKFTDEGGIVLAARLREGLARITVSDTGCGIAEDRQDQVFQAFEQTDDGIRTIEGTGLGLAISRQMARLMGGDVTAESVLGKGSSFHFTFAFAEGREESLEVRTERRKVRRLRAEHRGTRVLVVDDKPENREVAGLLLKDIGFALREATNGEEAVALTREWSPRVVLMDVVMPVMGGAEATERIKAAEWGRDTVIIAISASALDDEREYIMNHGVDGFIRKPFKEAELLEAIRHHAGVEYEYDDEESEETGLIDTPSPDAVSALPESLRRRLKEASVLGHLGQLRELAPEIAKTDEQVAKYLKQLVDEFELDEIRELFV